MRIQTEYIRYRNRWTISSSYDFQAHQQCSQRGCFSQTALQWFDVLTGLWLALSGLSPALPGAANLVAGAFRCSQACGWRFQTCRRRSRVLAGVPEGHCVGPVNSGIWSPWDSGPTTLRHSEMLLVTKIHFADVAMYAIKMDGCI